MDSSVGKSKKRRAGTGKILITIMVIVLAFILFFQIVRLHNKDLAYQEQEEQLTAELEEEEQRAEDLKEQESYIGTDAYVEEVARTKLGMVYPDEILFKEE